MLLFDSRNQPQLLQASVLVACVGYIIISGLTVITVQVTHPSQPQNELVAYSLQSSYSVGNACATSLQCKMHACRCWLIPLK